MTVLFKSSNITKKCVYRILRVDVWYALWKLMHDMKKLFPTFLLISCVISTLNAGYILERNAAMELMTAGKNQEAAEAFIKSAEATTNDLQQADALTNAALCMQRLKRNEEATALVAKIRSVSIRESAELDLLKEARNWKGIMDKTKTKDLSAWPEKVIFQAYLARGQAETALGQHKDAEVDLLRAQEFTVSPNNKAISWALIAENAVRAKADSQKLLDIYAKICALKPSGGIHQRALVARAKLFLDTNQYEQALAEVAALEAMPSIQAQWLCTAQINYGDIYAKQGKVVEALACYKKALTIPTAAPETLKEAQTKASALENTAK
jgi:tetratricopeptide (TPR) repeat protein